MARIYYSRQYYNQLKRKQYEEYHEEYLKRQNEYYLYEKKYYEEYLKRHNGYHLNKKKYYEEYVKRRNKYYLYQKKYYEEYLKRQNDIFANKRKYDKTYPSQSEFFNSFKTGSVEDNNINQDIIKNNSDGSLEINIEENKNCTSIEDLYNEKFLGEEDEDKNQVDKCNIEICKMMVSLETLPLCENIPHASDVTAGPVYDKTYPSQVNKCNIEICKTTVSSEILPLCENIPHTSDVTTGPVTVKIPVVLTECNITITVQSSLKLEDDLLEIKHIRKNVYLNQCELIPNSEKDKPNTGIIFLAGFIRKNIEYATKEHNDKDVLSGKIKHATVNVPFKCTTRVTFNTPPKFKANTSQDEVEILQTSIGVCNPCEEEIIGPDIREQSFRLTEFFNEKVFCELISAEFVESDILGNPINKECKSPLEQTFHDITEKVVLFLTIKLLQNQNVIISK